MGLQDQEGSRCIGEKVQGMYGCQGFLGDPQEIHRIST